MAAPAKSDGGSTCEAKRLALRIDDFEVAFYADIAIVIDDNFCGGHSVSGAPAEARSAES